MTPGQRTRVEADYSRESEGRLLIGALRDTDGNLVSAFYIETGPIITVVNDDGTTYTGPESAFWPNEEPVPSSDPWDTPWSSDPFDTPEERQAYIEAGGVICPIVPDEGQRQQQQEPPEVYTQSPYWWCETIYQPDGPEGVTYTKQKPNCDSARDAPEGWVEGDGYNNVSSGAANAGSASPPAPEPTPEPASDPPVETDPYAWCRDPANWPAPDFFCPPAPENWNGG